MAMGFYFDAESCIACHTCQVACKDVNHTEPGENYRIVRSFCTGSGFEVGWYNVSMAVKGCTTCAKLRELGEEPSCVASCPMRALEFGDLDELREKHAGELLVESCAAVSASEFAYPTLMRAKAIMDDPDFDEFAV